MQRTYFEKALIATCLFLFLHLPVRAQELSFSESALAAYSKVLNLDPAQARLVNGPGAGDAYVRSLADAVELVLTEDAEKLSLYQEDFEKRIDKNLPSTADNLFLKAEAHLYWVFVYLKFGQEFDAALQLRKAYLATREVRKKFPGYQPILKTSGLLNVMIGSVPDKYNWVLDLLDMKGDVSQGLKELKTLAGSSHVLSREATLWHAFILGFVLQQPKEGLTELSSLPGEPGLAERFLLANLYLKNSESSRALETLHSMEGYSSSSSFPYLWYLKAETLLHKGLYEESVSSYEAFLSAYKGQNYLKDSYYKMGICLTILNDEPAAAKQFEVARRIGKETTEADRYAARALREDSLPAIPLMKMRYFTDGGYYDKALEIARTLDENTFTRRKDRIEFLYRKARLYHKSNDLPNAVALYRKTIALDDNSGWYFAPNACLQLGYIYMEDGKFREARDYFNKALSYRRHEYKNSIDSKARSALDQLKDRK